MRQSSNHMADLATSQSRTSPLRDFVNRLQAAHTVASGVSPYARAGLHTLRAGGTSLLTGATLGAVHGKYGLDYKGKHPVDGYLALAAAAATLVLANDPDGLGVEARSVMSVAAGVFAFRKGEEWAKSHKEVLTTHHGDDEEDPILAAARGLDQAA
jgi:hypothetical protein